MVLQDKALPCTRNLDNFINFCSVNNHRRTGHFRPIHETIQRVWEAHRNKFLLFA